jgi:glycosyltransferase involved in cell wall biosynthesis
LVVELPHVKSKLFNIKGYPNDKIDIVQNCFSAVYLHEEQWLQLSHSIKISNDCINIGYVGRAYSHKNLNILLPVIDFLNGNSNIKYKFYVTLTDDEWAIFSEEYKDNVCNVGHLAVAQCPSFYKLMDGVIFPSLLECFSATPLEAMVMKKPLFASDRDFVKDICGKHVIYINPIDPEDIGLKIRSWYEGSDECNRYLFLENAYRHVRSLPDSKDRATGYIDLIRKIINA